MHFRFRLMPALILLLGILGLYQPAIAADPTAKESAVLQQADIIPPTTFLIVDSPQYTFQDMVWVRPDTSHIFTAVDNVDPPGAIKTWFRFYRVAATEPPDFQKYVWPFNLTRFDGRYRIEFYSKDSAGNVEPLQFRIEHLDGTPPLATWTPGAPIYESDGQIWITNETLHTLTAEDRTAPDGTPGSGVDQIRFRVSGAPFNPSTEFFVYETPFIIDGPDGQYEIHFFATDRVENRGQTYTVQTFLDTSPPVIDIGGPYRGNEGETFTFDASRTFDAGAGLQQIAWDLDSDGNFDDAVGPIATQTYGDNGTPAIGIYVSDHLGNDDIVSTSVEVHNVPPAVTITRLSPARAAFGQPVILEGTFTDPGWLDTHTVTVDWGDGNRDVLSAQTVHQPPAATGTFSAQHTYAQWGSYPISVTVTDDDGGAGTASTQVETALSTQMPGTLVAGDEITFYRLTGTTGNSRASAEWQWQTGHGTPRYWHIGAAQGYLFLFLKTPNDAPYYDPQQPTQPWQNFLSIAVAQENFQRWFWCGIYLYDENDRTIGIGCHPRFAPPPDGAGELPPWMIQRMAESQSHINNIIQNTFP